ncbi:phosphonate transport system substrate-binding protein [Chromohalobacter marismortui]|uniref:Phosphonate transport system substrate-binding protein n=1 Tax=Chromohalobacter marismortui TaxID=42055 RepID=A0A4R7NLJ7_9GAMM|nr:MULTISPECIES: putative selenate ABC transporter substrate-binding protein [Chromohalobacter]MCI0510226.1 putative selenate ABC transporter substrate-binding protein [Chromohalobacter sp.]MCI0593402.1 putative selenate ABC transporter substrate-binding protein [Chromohalobacter sp.]TDU21644.1 phosphonate transport system substrate-binding protein [Chromohalobacter marismortui]
MRWLLACLLILVSTAASAETFRFTAIPDADQSRLQERFDKVAAYLEKQLDVDVEYVPVKSYSAAVSAFRNDQVQLAWFGGLTGVQARRLVPDSRAIAQGKEDAEFRTYFIANTHAGIKPQGDDLPKNVQGKTFTFGAKTSTSGRLMPEYFIRKQFGAPPKSLFSRVGFSGDHSRTIALVESGAYDLGAVNFKVWEDAVAEDRVDTDKVDVIWKTPTYPDYQWTIRGDIDARYGDGFTDKVRQALLDMDDPELLESFPRQDFIPADNDDYQPIEDIGEKLGLLR